MSFIFAEYLTHYAADFAQRCIGSDGLEDVRHEVFVLIVAGLFKRSKCSLNSGIVALSLHLSQLCLLLFTHRSIYAQQIFRSFFFNLEFIDADDGLGTGLNIHLPFVSAVLNFLLDVALLDGCNSAADLVANIKTAGVL